MLGSVALDVAIGLALVFFVIAVASSAVVELLSQILGKRSADLRKAIDAMIGQVDPAAYGVGSLYDTAVLRSLRAASNQYPSYVSARAFADATVEVLVRAKRVAADGVELVEQLPPELAQRLEPMIAEVGNDLTAVRAGLETWFDDNMARLNGHYKRWATAVLFVVGLALTIGANASAFTITQAMWDDAAVRDAVVGAADGVVSDGGQGTAGVESDLQAVADTVAGLDSLDVPIGWQGYRDWDASQWAGAAGGWLITALLVMNGAPFWFDLLTRLVTLRASGPKPPPATEDSASATRALARGSAPRAASTTIGATQVPAERDWADVLYHLV